MFAFVTRLVGLACLAGGFAALVIDGSRSIAASGISMTRFGSTLTDIFPRVLASIQPAIERSIHPLLWDPMLTTLLMVPTSVVLSFFGLVLLWIVRPRPAEIGYSSRP